MSDFLMKPKIDYAFKEIMMDEKARIGFLSAVLNLNPADIRKTELLNTSLRKLHEDEKQGIVDVRILMNNNTEIDILTNYSETCNLSIIINNVEVNWGYYVNTTRVSFNYNEWNYYISIQSIVEQSTVENLLKTLIRV